MQTFNRKNRRLFFDIIHQAHYRRCVFVYWIGIFCSKQSSLLSQTRTRTHLDTHKENVGKRNREIEIERERERNRFQKCPLFCLVLYTVDTFDIPVHSTHAHSRNGVCAKHGTHCSPPLITHGLLIECYLILGEWQECTMYIFCCGRKHSGLWHYSCRTGYLVWLVRVCMWARCTCVRTCFRSSWCYHICFDLENKYFIKHITYALARICRMLRF